MIVLFQVHPKPTEHFDRSLWKSVEFLGVSPVAGQTIGVRNLSNQKILVSFGERVFSVHSEFQFIPTSPDVTGTVPLFILNDKGDYSYGRLELRSSSGQKNIPRLTLAKNLQTRLRNLASQIEDESKIIQATLLTSGFSEKIESWKAPLESKEVSSFGSLRRLPTDVVYTHSGIDLRAKTGTPIFAAARGKVVGVFDHVVSGKNVIIDHGRGVMTRYLHLSEFKVDLGQIVDSQNLIGLSGDTGRVEAPHLHFEIRIGGKAVDPISTLSLLNQVAQIEKTSTP